MSKEPAVILGALGAIVVALASVFNIVIDPDTLQTVILALVPLVTGVLTRFHVVPAAKVNSANDTIINKPAV